MEETYKRGGNYMLAEREAMFREDFSQMAIKTGKLNPGKILTLKMPQASVQPDSANTLQISSRMPTYATQTSNESLPSLS